MRKIEQLQITAAVIHALDNSIEQPIISDFELDLTTPEVKDFLESHIRQSLRDEKTKAAKFNEDPNVVKQCVETILANPTSFLINSQILARRLHTVMQTNKNISSGDLVVCLYNGDQSSYIGILKMDYHDTFIHAVDIIDGKTKVTIKREGISLPNIKQKLQKSVFIRAYNEENEFDMLILDRQVARSLDTEVANFLAKGFLDCTLAIDDITKTKLFYKKTEQWISQNLEGEPLEQKRIIQLANTILKEGTAININNISDIIFGDNIESKEQFTDFLIDQGLGDYEFNVDKEWVKKNLTKRTIKTTDGIEIKGNAVVLEDREKVLIEEKENGKVDILIKWIFRSKMSHGSGE